MPQFFGHERHDRMEHPKNTLQNFNGKWNGIRLELYDLKIPVAEIAPDKIIENLRGIVDLVVIKGVSDIAGAAVGARKDPLIRQCCTRFEAVCA